MNFKLRNPNFSTRILAAEPGADLFDVAAHRPVRDLCADRGNPFKPSPVFVRADPFLFAYRGELHLFFEQQVTVRRAVIRMTRTRDLKTWSDPVTVLDEPFHLSFPFVFGHQGSVYMMPECHQSGSIRLYKAQDDTFTRWSHAGTLLSGAGFVDSSIICREGIYYLFTTTMRQGRKQLELYFSDRPDGGYRLHPSSPYCTGEDGAQCGGAVFEWNGRIYRPAQDSSQEYGKQLRIFQVTALSPAEYAEELIVPAVFPSHIPFYRHGGHHFNPVVFDGRTIIATDARQLSFNVFGFAERAALFLKRKRGKRG